MEKANLALKIPVSILKEGKKFVAYTPVLDLSTSGRSVKSVKKHFSEIVEIFFDELLKKGTMDEVLTDLGWKKIKKQWAPPEEIEHCHEFLRVPAMVA